MPFPQREPDVERALAAVTVVARMQRREERTERLELAPSRAATLERAVPGLPSEFLDRRHHVLARIVARKRCTLCAVRPGFGPCPYCTGTGCAECEGGWSPCTTCDGTREIALSDVRFVEDRSVTLVATYTASLPAWVEAVLRETFDVAADPPDVLAFELERPTAFAPYRVVQRAEESNTLLGHSYEEPLRHARRAIASMRAAGEVSREDVRAWIRPFLYVEWNDDPESPMVVLREGTSFRVLRRPARGS